MSKVTMDVLNTEEIGIHETFETLFPIKDDLLAKIENDMREGTYDLSQPVILATWGEQKEPVCIDGHTRLKAAINAGIEDVPVFILEFDDKQQALEKAIRLQRNRRNITDAEIVACVEALDTLKPRGGDRRSEEAKSKASSDAIEKPSSKSAQDTAELLGTSTSKVERVRSVLKDGDPDMLEAVKNGEMSINKACNETRKKRKINKSQMEKESEEKIETIQEKHYVIPEDLLADLEALGGLVNEHIDVAITAYLYLSDEQREAWMRKVYGEDDEPAAGGETA